MLKAFLNPFDHLISMRYSFSKDPLSNIFYIFLSITKFLIVITHFSILTIYKIFLGTNSKLGNSVEIYEVGMMLVNSLCDVLFFWSSGLEISEILYLKMFTICFKYENSLIIKLNFCFEGNYIHSNGWPLNNNYYLLTHLNLHENFSKTNFSVIQIFNVE